MTNPKSTQIRIATALIGCFALASCAGNDADFYKEFHKKLGDGRVVTCLSAGNSNSFTCDWAGAE